MGITDDEQLKKYARNHLLEVQGLDPELLSADEISDALSEAVDDAASEKKAQVFKRTVDGHHPYIEGRQVKALIKEATSIAYPRGAHKFGQYKNTKGVTTGGKDPMAYVAERVFIAERPIVVADEVSGIDLAVGHIKDWKGDTRSTLGYFEYVEYPEITIEVEVSGDCLTEDQWSMIWSHAERQGLGARRSQGAGQFVTTRWELAD